MSALSDVTISTQNTAGCLNELPLTLAEDLGGNPLRTRVDASTLESGCEGLKARLEPGTYWLTVESDGVAAADYELQIAQTILVFEEVDKCYLQAPTALTPMLEGDQSEVIYARIFEAGLTDETGGIDSPESVRAEFGYGPVGDDPTTSVSWMWQAGKLPTTTTRQRTTWLRTTNTRGKSQPQLRVIA